MAVCGVYSIINPKGRIYIGSSSNIQKRFKDYEKLKCKSQQKIYHSLLKYGVNSHVFSVIKICKKEEIYKYERELGLFFNTLDKNELNLQLPAFGKLPQIQSEETKLKKRNISIGRKLSEESKRKISENNKGKKSNSGSFKKGHKLNLGVPKTESARKNMSKSRLGMVLSEKHKKNISIANTGKKMSEEAINNWKKARAGYTHSEETRKLIGEKGKGRVPVSLQKPIEIFTVNNLKIGEYKCISYAAKNFNVCRTAIGNNLIGRSKFFNTNIGKVYAKYKN